MKIIFFGTPEFAAYSLERIIESEHKVLAVVTMPDKPAGRGHKLLHSAVKKSALAHSIPLLQPKNLKDPDFLRELGSFGADLFVVIAFRMLPEVVWSMPPAGTFNLHASLLPRYRGAAPINRAIMNGEKETGVTTFFLSHEIDTGDIIDARSEPVSYDDDAGSLHDRLMVLGAEMTIQTLNNLNKGEVVAKKQPDGEYVPAPKIFKEDCRIVWNRPAEKVYNQIRGLSPYPAAFTLFNTEQQGDTVVKIFKSRIAEEHTSISAGKILVDGNQLYIGTATLPLQILYLQPAGKKPMEADAFLRGYTPLRISEL